MWTAAAGDAACAPHELSALSLAGGNATYTGISFMPPGRKWDDVEARADGEFEL